MLQKELAHLRGTPELRLETRKPGPPAVSQFPTLEMTGDRERLVQREREAFCKRVLEGLEAMDAENLDRLRDGNRFLEDQRNPR